MKALNYFPTIDDELVGTNKEIALAVCEISKLYLSVLRLRRGTNTRY